MFLPKLQQSPTDCKQSHPQTRKHTRAYHHQYIHKCVCWSLVRVTLRSLSRLTLANPKFTRPSYFRKHELNLYVQSNRFLCREFEFASTSPSSGQRALCSKFKVPRKAEPKWFNSKIRFKLNCARTKRRRFRSNSTVINQLKVLAVESKVNSMIMSAKESYMTKICKQFSLCPRQL